MEKSEIAVEELKLLQEIIGRQDILMARTKAFCITLTSALTVAYLKEDPKIIEDKEFLVVALVLALLFWFIESVYGAVEITAEKRVKTIERSFIIMNGNNQIDVRDYDGPKICHSLVDSFERKSILAAARREQTFLLYLTIGILSILVFIFT